MEVKKTHKTNKIQNLPAKNEKMRENRPAFCGGGTSKRRAVPPFSGTKHKTVLWLCRAVIEVGLMVPRRIGDVSCGENHTV